MLYVINHLEAGHSLDHIDGKEETLLHKASRNNHYEIVDLLLRWGADVHATNRHGDTPLHLAVQFKAETVVARLLLEDAKVNAANRKKMTPLHIAASRGKEEILNMLLDHNAKNSSMKMELNPFIMLLIWKDLNYSPSFK